MVRDEAICAFGLESIAIRGSSAEPGYGGGQGPAGGGSFYGRTINGGRRGTAAASDDAVEFVCGSGIGTGEFGNLRSYVEHGGAANARNRGAHGTRGRAAKCARTGAKQWHAVNAAWHCAGYSRRICVDAVDEGVPLSGDADRSGHFCGSGVVSILGSAAGELHSGAASDTSRSGGRAALRMSRGMSGCPSPPFPVSADSKGFRFLCKSFRISQFWGFLEVFILKDLQVNGMPGITSVISIILAR